MAPLLNSSALVSRVPSSPLFVRASKRCPSLISRATLTSTPPVTLRYNKLGDSDLLISEVTLGTMTWGNQNTEKEAHEQLSYAFDNGINILDSAEVYPVPISKEKEGNTDRIINSWLKTRARDKVIIATKVSGFSNRETSLRDNLKGMRVDATNIKESVEKSLKRLGTDYIDLLQIHWSMHHLLLPDCYTVSLLPECYMTGATSAVLPGNCRCYSSGCSLIDATSAVQMLTDDKLHCPQWRVGIRKNNENKFLT